MDPIDAAEPVAGEVMKVADRSRMGRFMLRQADNHMRLRPPEERESISSLMLTVFTVLAGALIGTGPDQFSESAVDELIDVTGMTGLVNDRVGGQSIIASYDALRGDLISVLKSMSVDALDHASQSVSVEKLVEARSRVLAMRPFLVNFFEVMKKTRSKRTFGLAFPAVLVFGDDLVAVLIVLIAHVSTLGGEDFDRELEALRPVFVREGARYEALNKIVSAVPPHLRKYLGVEGELLQAGASVSDREQLRAAISDFEARHPDIFAIASAAPSQ